MKQPDTKQHTSVLPKPAFNPFAALNGQAQAPRWSLAGLDALPEVEWKRMRAFLGLSAAEMEAMLETVEVLFKRGHELVVGTYDALLANSDTAAILGWEGGSRLGAPERAATLLHALARAPHWHGLQR